jgi:hypothetical protein
MYEPVAEVKCLQQLSGPSSDVLRHGFCEKKTTSYKTGNRYNITMRRVSVAIVAVDKQSVLHILHMCL